MARLGSLVVVLAVLVVGGCGGTVDPRSAPIVFDDAQAAQYTEAHEVCTGSSPADLKVEKNARSTEPQAIATAYSLVFPQELRVPTFEGCLDALEGRPPRSR